MLIMSYNKYDLFSHVFLIIQVNIYSEVNMITLLFLLNLRYCFKLTETKLN